MRKFLLLALFSSFFSADMQAAETLYAHHGKMSRSFPQSFLFGSSISGFQAEMGCPGILPELCEDRNSDWYQFISDHHFLQNKLLYISGDSPQSGPGFFETYREDLDRVQKELKNNSLRVSLEWSRIFPQETFALSRFEDLRKIASPEGLRFYHSLFQEMKARGIKPLVTLNHYTLPTWIHDAAACNRSLKNCARKGWADPEKIVPEIAKYAGFAAQEFAGEVDLWATLNEPITAVVFPAYIMPTDIRSNPPGLHLHIKDGKRAARAMIEAHARMYDAIHAADKEDADGDGKPASVGLVNVYGPVIAKNPGTADEESAKGVDYLLNHMFLRAAIDGELDEEWNGKTVPRPDLGNRMDYIGINYYMAIEVRKAEVPVLTSLSSLLDIDPIFSRDFGDRPQGIYEIVRDLARYKRPMVITETGTDAQAHPKAAEDWLQGTLAWTRQAIADGYDIRGFYYWTLFDNYEWNLGTKMRMGLFSIEPDDPFKSRIPRSAVPAYRRIGETKRIPRAAIEALFPL